LVNQLRGALEQTSSAALKTSSKMKVAESILVCVDLKNLWISSAPSLDASAVTILSTINSQPSTPPRPRLSNALLEDPDLRLSKTHAETKDLLFLGLNFAGLQINT
jgi:hypothetical protein